MSQNVLSIILAISIYSCGTTPAFAQEANPAEDKQYEVYRLPEHIKIGVDEGVYACYTLEQYKLLLTMDNDLNTAEGQVANSRSVVANLFLSQNALRAALDESELQLKLMTEDRKRITEKWKSDNLAKHQAENRPLFGGWVPWAISGVLVVALGGVVTILVVS